MVGLGFFLVGFGFLQGSGKGLKLCNSVRQVNMILHSAMGLLSHRELPLE